MVPVVFLALATAPFHPVFAQATTPQGEARAVPGRNDNIWAGRDHQPSRVETESSEQRAGETTPTQERRDDDEVARIQRQIEQNEQRYPPGFLDSKP
jgi:hypothetical protein